MMDLTKKYTMHMMAIGIIWNLFCWQEAACLIPTDLRIVEGVTPFDGVVEVQLSGIWRRVCQMGWSFEIAEHVCHHNGFKEGAMLHRSETTMEMKSGALPKFSCYLSPQGVVNCQRIVSCSLAAGVSCNIPGYLGCYQHSRQDPINSAIKFNNDSMTIEKCMEFCRMGRYKYAGLAFGRECLCENRGPVSWTGRETDNSNCLLPCRGDRWESCGGVQQAEFYETRIGVCGGKLKPLDGYITSPLFPSDYDRGSICTWKVIRDNLNIERFIIHLTMLNLLPGDTIRITEIERGNWARTRVTILLIDSQMTHLQGTSMNVSAAGFYVEFQSALSTTGQGDPGFVITYEPYQKPTSTPLTTVNASATLFTTIYPKQSTSMIVDNSGEQSTTYLPPDGPTTTGIPHQPARIVAAVATVGIGGGIAAVWGVSMVAMFLRKKLPHNMLKYYRSRSSSDASRRQSFDSDTVSYTASYTDSYAESCSGSYSESITGSDTFDPNALAGFTFVDAADIPEGATHVPILPQKSRFQKASRALSTIVEHVYSSVYIPGRTMRGPKRGQITLINQKRKPTVAPKPDIIPIRELKEAKNGVYDQPCPGESGKARISSPLYQNIVKYTKKGRNPPSYASQDNKESQEHSVGLVGNEITDNEQGVKHEDRFGYLVPEGRKDTSRSKGNESPTL